MLKIYSLLVLFTMALNGNAFAQKRKNTATKTVITSTSPVVITQTPTSTTISSGVGGEKKTNTIVNFEKVANPDLIYQTNGLIIQAKIMEVSPTEIIYKKWNNLDGPIFRISRNDVKKIKYSNGEEDNNIQAFPSQNTVNQRTTSGNNSSSVSTTSSSSQYPKPAPTTGSNQKRFGILGGINSYKFNRSTSLGSSKSSSSTGFNIGFVGDFPLNSDFSLRVLPYASFKNTIFSNGQTLSITSISTVLNGLYHIPSSQGDFILGGGLALDYLLSIGADGTSFNIGNNPVTDDFLPLDYGINITGGYDARTWSASVYYTFGIANLNPAYGKGSSITYNSSTVGLQLNYWFGN